MLTIPYNIFIGHKGRMLARLDGILFCRKSGFDFAQYEGSLQRRVSNRIHYNLFYNFAIFNGPVVQLDTRLTDPNEIGKYCG